MLSIKKPLKNKFKRGLAEKEGLGLFGDILSYLGKSFIHGDNIILFPYIYPILTDHLTDHHEIRIDKSKS